MNETDSIINLVVHGATPSKKNSNKINCMGKYPRTYKTKSFREWYAMAIEELKLTCNSVKPLETTQCINLTFYTVDKRKRDLTNIAESIMDLLVDGEVIEDDNVYIISRMTLNFGGLDREDPRCEIEII